MHQERNFEKMDLTQDHNRIRNILLERRRIRSIWIVRVFATSTVFLSIFYGLLLTVALARNWPTFVYDALISGCLTTVVCFIMIVHAKYSHADLTIPEDDDREDTWDELLIHLTWIVSSIWSCVRATAKHITMPWVFLVMIYANFFIIACLGVST